jgi:hypothetical protein
LNIAVNSIEVPLGDMAPPPSTTKKPAFGIQGGGGLGAGLEETGAAKGTEEVKKAKEKKKKGKVPLAPGCGALDWARLTSSGANLRVNLGPFPS